MVVKKRSDFNLLRVKTDEVNKIKKKYAFIILLTVISMAIISTNVNSVDENNQQSVSVESDQISATLEIYSDTSPTGPCQGPHCDTPT
jgi:hypothetical protein